MFNILKIGLILSISLIIDPDMSNPDIEYSYQNNLVTLCDKNRRELSPTQFSRVDYLGHGLYLCWGTNPQDKYEYGKERFLYNRNGEKLNVPVPEGSNFVHVCWLGAAAERDSNLELTQLPEDALLRFSSENQFGLCNPKGEIILPAKYGFIGKGAGGKAFISDGGSTKVKTKAFYIFDCAQKKLTELPLVNVFNIDRLCLSEGLTYIKQGQFLIANAKQDPIQGKEGYFNEDGKFVIEGSYVKAGPFHRGMAAVTLRAQHEPFVETNVIIDRSGKTVSPPNLDMQDFYGEYAIAKDMALKPPKYGIVNRKFEFVVPPKYESLKASPKSDQALLKNPVAIFEKSLPFYEVKETQDGLSSLITPTGEILVTLPPGIYSAHLLENGTICAWRMRDRSHGESVFLTMSGKVLPQPKSYTRKDSEGHTVSYASYDQKLTLKYVTLDNGHFDPELWKSNHGVFSRTSRFAKFLDEYDLIGMSKQKLLRLLGPGSRPCTGSLWYKTGYSCLGSSYLVINVENDRVIGWSFQSGFSIKGQEEKPEIVTTNVVLDPFTGQTKPKHRPKS